jgi:hypothetical protein
MLIRRLQPDANSSSATKTAKAAPTAHDDPVFHALAFEGEQVGVIAGPRRNFERAIGGHQVADNIAVGVKNANIWD